MSSAPQEVREARLALGRRLAALRKATGYTQHGLAPLTLYGRSTVANVELGRQSVGRDFWVRCDAVLGTGGILAADYDRMHVLARQSTLAAAHSGTAVHAAAEVTAGVTTPADALSLLLTESSAAVLTSGRHQVRLWAPAGRYFPGLGIDVQVHAAITHDRVLAAVPDRYGDDPFLSAPGCGLVVGRTRDGQAFGLDRRHARRRLRHAAAGARLPIPSAYRLDELTCAVVWALANLDHGLLDDDALLAGCEADVADYARMPRSAVSRDLAADLSPVARMWLGSAFCAGHIRRHADQLRDTPVFWTRECRGEEASGWLLFAHKHDYLQATAAARLGHAHALRVFCVPQCAVEVSPRPERILLLLAAALIESYGIAVAVTYAPEYTAVAGFVTDQRTAVVANWVGADGLWHVDVTDHRPTIREYTDAADHATAHTVVAGADAPARLRAFAAYLDLDWPWLVTRCRDLGEAGVAGLARPRSRHLSTAGVDRACQYLAACGAAR